VQDLRQIFRERAQCLAPQSPRLILEAFSNSARLVRGSTERASHNPDAAAADESHLSRVVHTNDKAVRRKDGVWLMRAAQCNRRSSEGPDDARVLRWQLSDRL
jgi:hypothetical protein